MDERKIIDNNLKYTTLQKILNEIFSNQNIKYEDFGIAKEQFDNIDMAMIKKIPESGSIVFSGEQKDILTYAKLRNCISEFKKDNISFKVNLQFIFENKTRNSYLIANEFANTNSSSGIQLSIQKNDSDDTYKLFEDTLKPESILIILKIAKKSEYIFLSTKYKDIKKHCDDLYFEGNQGIYYLFKSKKAINISYPKIIESHNRLIYGAPGTGKSNLLKSDIKKYIDKYNESKIFYERVTFYPDYSYGEFVGMYKPVSEGNDIKYKYIEGPFLKLLGQALKNKNKNNRDFILIIEEINRANASSVFGDMFQLLDRDEFGNSEYTISLSKDQKQYLNSIGLTIDKLYLPSNFYIWATMNSGDQGVMPLDSAFKRRFDDYKLIGIDENQSVIENITVKINDIDGTIKWNDFRKALNTYLSDTFNVREDKLIGPFFIKPEVLKNEVKFNNAFQDKLLMYLAEDVLNHNKQKLFGTNSLSKIKENYKDGAAFKEKFWEGITNVHSIETNKIVSDGN